PEHPRPGPPRPAGLCQWRRLPVRLRDPRPARGRTRVDPRSPALAPADASGQPQPQPVQRRGRARVRGLAPARVRRRQLIPPQPRVQRDPPRDPPAPEPASHPLAVTTMSTFQHIAKARTEAVLADASPGHPPAIPGPPGKRPDNPPDISRILLIFQQLWRACGNPCCTATARKGVSATSFLD